MGRGKKWEREDHMKVRGDTHMMGRGKKWECEDESAPLAAGASCQTVWS